MDCYFCGRKLGRKATVCNFCGKVQKSRYNQDEGFSNYDSSEGENPFSEQETANRPAEYDFMEKPDEFDTKEEENEYREAVEAGYNTGTDDKFIMSDEEAAKEDENSFDEAEGAAFGQNDQGEYQAGSAEGGYTYDIPEEIRIDRDENSFQKSNKKVLLIFLTAAFVFIALLLLFFLNFKEKPAGQFIRAFNDGDSKTAVLVFNEGIKGNTAREAEIRQELGAKADMILSDYNNGTLDFETVREKLNIIQDTGLLSFKYEELEKRLNELRDSKNAFENGLKAQKEKDFEAAWLFFLKVSKQDTNYAESRELIRSVGEQLVMGLVEEGKQTKDAKELKLCIDTVNLVLEKVDLSKNYDHEKAELMEKYSLLVIGQANDLIKAEKFEEAIALLNDNQEYQVGSNISDKILEIQEKDIKGYYVKRIRELKARVTAGEDNSGNTRVVPKGNQTTYNNITETVNIESFVNVKGIAVTLYFDCGLILSDPISFEEVVISCDDSSYKWNFGYYNKRTEELEDGRVQEIGIVEHNPSLLSGDVITGDGNFEALVKSVAGSNTVKMRFKGEDDERTHTLTQAEKNNITLLWEVYKILSANPNLIKELV